MKLYDQQKLEKIFANNFETPLFPVLANLYYEKKEYKRAQKVCKIGLSHNPNNYVGQFILAKTYFADKQYQSAEIFFKTVVTYDSHNANALIFLVETQAILKRSKTNIQGNINKGLQLGIEHALFKKLKTRKKKSVKNVLQPSKEVLEIPTTPHTTIQINTTMATKTMYKLMVQQKKYDVAMAILEIMKTNKKNNKFVNLEQKKLQQAINKRNKKHVISKTS